MFNILKDKKDNLKIKDRYYSHHDNRFIVIRDNNDKFITIHEKLKNHKWEEVNRWDCDLYYFGTIHERTLIPSLNIFNIQNGKGGFNALYNYEKDQFLTPLNMWDEITFDASKNEFLAKLFIKSSVENDDFYAYDDEFGNKHIKYFFTSESYMAILDKDGQVQDNKLFTKDHEVKVIDLNNYPSLEEFVKERQQYCDTQKQLEKENFFYSLPELKLKRKK